MVCYKTCVLVIAIVTNECTDFLPQKYGFKVCVVSFGFWSSCLKVYIRVCFINTQRWTATPFSLRLPFLWVSLICWYCASKVLRFVWNCLVFIQLVIKFISIYPASTHSDEHQKNLTAHTSYHLSIAKHWDCIRFQPMVVREIVTLV